MSNQFEIDIYQKVPNVNEKSLYLYKMRWLKRDFENGLLSKPIKKWLMWLGKW